TFDYFARRIKCSLLFFLIMLCSDVSANRINLLLVRLPIRSRSVENISVIRVIFYIVPHITNGRIFVRYLTTIIKNYLANVDSIICNEWCSHFELSRALKAGNDYKVINSARIKGDMRQ